MPAYGSIPASEASRQLPEMKWQEHDLPLYDCKRIAEAPPIFIYNVSPIHRWERFQGQLGTVVIRARPAESRVSPPTIIMGEIARKYDKGLRRKEWMIEPGLDIAEDIVGCSSLYPADSPNNNLANFGVFITTQPLFKLSEDEKHTIIERSAGYLRRVPADEKNRILEALDDKISTELPAKQREELLATAEVKLDLKLRAIILEADQFHAEGHLNWVSDIHRGALKALNEIASSTEERPWAPIRMTAKKVSCEWCGILNKPGVALCQGCHNVINVELYNKLKKQQGKE